MLVHVFLNAHSSDNLFLRILHKLDRILQNSCLTLSHSTMGLYLVLLDSTQQLFYRTVLDSSQLYMFNTLCQWSIWNSLLVHKDVLCENIWVQIHPFNS